MLISTPPRLFPEEVGTHYSTLVIFTFMLSIISSGLMFYYLVEIIGFDLLIWIFGCFGAAGLLIVYYGFEDEPL